MEPEPTSIADLMPPARRPDHNAVAAAFEKRLQAERERAAAAAASAVNSSKTFDSDHEKRQEFRRMVDPGILRPNPRDAALESLQVRTAPVPLESKWIDNTYLRTDASETCGEHHCAPG